MRTCKQCGGEITNKFCNEYCVGCIERAMDALTPDDIGAALRDIVNELDPLDFSTVALQNEPKN